MPDRISRWLARHATKLLVLSIAAGIGAPPLAAALRPRLAEIVWALLFLAAMRVDWDAVGRHARRPAPVVLAAAWIVLGAPVVLSAIVTPFGLPPGIEAALVLSAASAPILSAPALCMILGLDAALCLLVMALTTLAVPFSLPAVAVGLLDLEFGVTAGELMWRLGVLVGSAMAAAAAARKLLGRERVTAAAGPLDSCMLMTLMVFAIAIMDGIGAVTIDRPTYVMAVVALSFAANAGMQAYAAAPFVALGRRRALTVAFCAGNRNMAIILAVIPAGVMPDLEFYLVLAQVPMFVLPALLGPVYRRAFAAEA